MEEKKSLISIKDFISGSAAGVVQVLLGQPFDIVKVRMQTSSIPISPIQLAKNIYTQEGALAFYSGTTSPLIGISLFVAIQFGSNEIAKKYFKRKKGHLSVKDSVLGGMFSGFCGSFIASPVELFRIKMQVQGSNGNVPLYANTIDCARKVFNQHGLKGVYQGLGATIIREIPAVGVYFGVYETLMTWSEQKYKSRKNIPMINVTLYGALAGLSLWTATFPIDVVKSKIQSENLDNPKYNTIKNTVSNIYAEKGVGGFFKGLTPCLIRAPPINAATFLTFEVVQKLQSKNK